MEKEKNMKTQLPTIFVRSELKYQSSSDILMDEQRGSI